MNTQEEWRNIPGIDNRYMVSNLGNVKSLCARSRGRVLKASLTPDGYSCLKLRTGKASPTVRLVHKIVALAFINANPGHLCVKHINGVNTDNRAENLCFLERKSLRVKKSCRILKRDQEKRESPIPAGTLEGELWAWIEDREGIHSVSSLGRVSSFIFDRSKGRLLAQNLNRAGYPVVWLSGKTTSIHRLVAKAFLTMPFPEAHVNHINFIRNDNRVENLEWVTAAQNIRHSWVNGRYANTQYEKNCIPKLSKEDVLNIRSEYKKGYREVANLSKKYNVARGTIHKIVNGKRRGSVK